MRRTQTALTHRLSRLLVLTGLLTGAAPLGAQDATNDPALEQVKRLEAAIVKVVAKTSPAYVVIGGGSGVIISPDGFMLTNHHVAGSRAIGDAWRIKIPSEAGGEIHSAAMIATDPFGDISLLKLDNSKRASFPYVELGDSDKLEVGDWVVALGNPFGYAKDSTPTVTVGLVSSFNRYRGNYGDAIQTDAAINPGNSGGPLLDIQGRLVGINGSITTRHGVKINSGAGYAISVNQIKRFMPRMKVGGIVAHGSVTGLNVTNSANGGDGAIVSAVSLNSPAASAGFRKDDRILTVAGLPIQSSERFRGVISTFPAGEVLAIVVRRDGKDQTLDVPLSGDSGARSEVPAGAYLGVQLRDEDKRVIVEGVVAGSPAAEAGIEEGDVIEGLDGKDLGKVNDLLQILRGKQPGAKIKLRVRRGDDARTLDIVLGKHPS